MANLKAEYEGTLKARLAAAVAAKDVAFMHMQRAEAAEAALEALRLENEGLRGPLATVFNKYCLTVSIVMRSKQAQHSGATAFNVVPNFMAITYWT